MNLKYSLLSLAVTFAVVQPAMAATERKLADADSTGGLRIAVDALAFFRDNEYSSAMTDGYSLPGAWVRPKLEYDPNKNIHLELGAHGLFFDGANKYPNYAYHDIGKWKGNQYQDGVHILPWLRAEAKMKGVSVVLGDIYGDVNHGIITPLYNKEQLMSADPEMGAQILVNHKGFDMDVWVNWQSYQFKEDTHQEAFIVGITGRQRLNSHLNIALNILAQHRGGEQDLPELNLGVQTICNGSLGVNWTSGEKPLGNVINSYGASANILGCYQQAGKLWPFDSGMAYHAEGNMQLLNCLSLALGYFHAPSDFVTLLGSPFFSTVSIRDDKKRFDGRQTGYLNIDYHRTFAGRYTLGALLETYKVHSKGLDESSFAFGLYLRVNPSWKL